MTERSIKFSSTGVKHLSTLSYYELVIHSNPPEIGAIVLSLRYSDLNSSEVFWQGWDVTTPLGSSGGVLSYYDDTTDLTDEMRWDFGEALFALFGKSISDNQLLEQFTERFLKKLQKEVDNRGLGFHIH